MPESGKEAALQLIERIVISSLLTSAGEEVPKGLDRILEFAPNGFITPYAGEIALAIRRAKQNGKAPSLPEVMSLLDGESLQALRVLAGSTDSLPLALAEIESGSLLRRLQFETLIATLGEAWQEAKEHPENATAVGRTAILAVERVLAEIPSASSLPAIVNAGQFLESEITPLPILVEGLFHQGTKLVLGGGSKAYKTWLLSDLAISIVAGLSWLGFKCIKGRVLYVNLEIQDRFFQERLKVLAAAKGVQFTPKSLDLWNLRGFASPYQTLVPMMIERIKSESYSLVIIDPIYKLYGATDENSAGEVAQLLNTLETLCVQTSAATAFGAHYSKGNQASKESIDRISGSGVFARDPDSIISFTKHEEEGCFTVEPILRNLPPADPFVVRWQYPLMHRDDDLDPSKLKQIKSGRQPQFEPLELLSYISNNTKENPISINAWAKISSVKRQTLSDYLGKMRSNHWIATIGEGTNARQYITESGLSALQ